MASANLDDLFGAGAKVSINIPLIVPEEGHLVWSLVIAGNLEQLRNLLAGEKNLVYVKNQWGQSIMHVSNTSKFLTSSACRMRLDKYGSRKPELCIVGTDCE